MVDCSVAARAEIAPGLPMARAFLCLLVWLLLPVVALASENSVKTEPDTPTQAEDDLRERLTRRVDKRRAPDPWQTEIAGRVLTVSGEFGLDLEQTRRPLPDTARRYRDRLSGASLEAQAFYSITDSLSMFVQWRLASIRQSGTGSPGSTRTRYAERGEMWLHSRDISGTGLNVEVGRLKFEDERRWWWDEELDALRVSRESDELEFSLAVARELGRNRSDRPGVDAQHNGIRRWMAHAAWEWQPDQSIDLFMLRHDDQSNANRIGQAVPIKARDASDARLTWTGASLHGGFNLRPAESLHYWLDLARLAGDERLVQFETPTPAPATRQDIVTDVSTGRLRGWAVDAGLRWRLPWPGEPRVSVAHASTFGGTLRGTQRGYRQTGLHSNRSDFGGLGDFERYGAALDPELSNLRITTIGVGLSPVADSSIDLVYHRYRQVKPAIDLREARLPTELTGLHTDIGSGLDLVATFQPSPRVEFSATVSRFRAGVAFGAIAGRRHYYGAVAMRVVF